MALGLPFHRSGIRGLHQSRTAAGDDVRPKPRQLVAEFLGLVVDGIAALNPRAAKHRHAVVLDPLRLNLIEIVDGLPELVNGLVEDVRRIDRRPLPGLPFPERLELRSRRLLVRRLLDHAGDPTATIAWLCMKWTSFLPPLRVLRVSA